MFNNLAVIAQNVLTIPTSSTASERDFLCWICYSRMENPASTRNCGRYVPETHLTTRGRTDNVKGGRGMASFLQALCSVTKATVTEATETSASTSG